MATALNKIQKQKEVKFGLISKYLLPAEESIKATVCTESLIYTVRHYITINEPSLYSLSLWVEVVIDMMPKPLYWLAIILYYILGYRRGVILHTDKIFS